ncbi:multidrug resistance protein, MATE family [Nonomuraea solani]|uniref:Multidrug resistance protein, MATE family n=1 Tax=Nonomuraea solani TaxID=1144553 RepID=A0A1H6EYG2_9ACTN|nr:polysaccharide biosynthesis C-terminal domain-containing protein [Nonomuraea solani]SEH01694.1 multidrug resistance protein, MATE family [Nonomuraea solani]
MIVLLRAAVPLFLAMVMGMIGSLVVTSVLGKHDTVTLAAFAVMTAVLTPATAAVQGALRGLGPFVAPHREDPGVAVPIVRDARWLSLATGALGAVAVLCVPLLAGVSGVPGEVVRELGLLPFFLAAYLLIFASTGGASTILVALGRSRDVLWSNLAFGLVLAALTVALVPRLGLTGVGIAWVVAIAVAAVVSSLCLRRAFGRPIGQARPRIGEIVNLAKVSIPLAGTVLIKFGVLGVVTFAASTTSTRDTAAHAVLTTLTGFIMTASIAIGQASVPEVARATDVAGARRANRSAALLAVLGTLVGAALLLGLGDRLLMLFSDDVAVRERVLALLPLMLLASAFDAAQAVQGIGLTALKRSASSLMYFAIGYGLLVVAAVPVARTWGITGLWVAMAVANALLVVLQGTGFRRHSARVVALAA